jgi:MscS family membrane protein
MTALVAGLGIGGVAIALVLQKPLEDVLGAITLFTQQPVSIGQFCTSGDTTGTIEEISMRATRVRKLNNSVVVIPNSVFATAGIENMSARRRVLHHQFVRLSLDTTESQIKSVLGKLREAVASNSKVVTGEWRVRFVELGEFSINVEVFVQVDTTDWEEFLAIAEDINLDTIGILEAVGVRIAIPRR